MIIRDGPGGTTFGGGYDFNDTSEILAMKTAIRTTKIGALSGAHARAVGGAGTGFTAAKVSVLNVPYDPELWAILALGGV